jgi:acyl-CoA synthetase (AMP-forming)/AMP-acid ligase II/acyl carrier protein
VERKVIEFSSLVDLLGCRADRDFGFTFLADAPDSGAAEASRLSFRELDERARAIGADLVERGLTGERALLVYPPGLDYVAAFFGCLCAGVVAVPVFPPDIFRLTRTLPRLAAVATDSQAKVILTDTLILPLSSTVSGQAGLEILAESDWIATDAIPIALAKEWRQPDIRPEATAFIQYTSGSTSTPKGVMLSHANLLENSALIKETFGHTTESRGMSWLPIYHDMGLIGGVLQPLYSDFPITLMSPLSFLARPMSWLQAVARDGVTTSGGPNFAYDLCVRKFDEQAADGLDLSAWRVAFNGAEPVRASTLDRFAETFAPYGFRKSAFLPCYGLAEATLIVTGKKAGEAVRDESFSVAGLGRGVAESSASPGDTMPLVGSGTACTGLRVAVVDTATGHELPDRRVGEIRVSGPSLGAGYWGQPDKSAETFVRSPQGGRWLRTGDLGFLDKGELFVTGRLKDLIIVRGRNIYPHDIEQAATDAVGELRPGCVAAFGTQRADGEELVVVAEVRREADLSAAKAITDRVRRAVTESQNVAVHEVVLVAPGTIPKTSSGKLQRSSCRQAYLDDTLEPLGRSRAEHVPEVGPDVDPIALRELSQEARHAPVTDYVIGLLVSACGSAFAEISAAEPITSLGLDSLASVLVLHRIELQLDIELPVSTLLTGRSITELVDLICAQLDESPRAVTPASQETQNPLLSEGQRSLWFMQQLDPDSSAYNLARAFAIGRADRPDDLDREALDASLCLLLERNTSLRTTFHSNLGIPVCRIAPPARTLLRTVTIAPDALDDAMAEEAEQPFDLERDPLLRAVLFVTPAAAPVLLITVHHIAVDLWSFGILLRELSVMYPALAEGRHPALPAPSSYQAYVRHQQETLRTKGASLAAYWHGKLAGELPVVELPDPRTRPAVQTYAGATWRQELSTQQTAQIKALATAAKSTSFLVLLSGLQTVLQRYTGVDDIVIGTVVAGRRQAASASIVGYLVNTVVLRADLSGDPSFVELLGRNGIMLEEAVTHQDYPFSRVTADMSKGSDPSRSPLFQVMVAFEQSPGEPALAGLAVDEPGCTLNVGDTAWVSRPLPSRGAAFDLTLRVVETSGRLITSWEYNTDVLEEGLVARLSLDLAALLGAAADTPERRIGELPLPSGTGDTVGQDLSDMARKSGTRDPGDPATERAETGPTSGEPADDPVDQVSETIRQIYADLLEIPDIGPDDDFFEEGGHSLLATQLAARVRAGLGVELSTRVVFTASTVRQLAAHVTSEQRASGRLSASGPRAMPTTGPAPLSYPQTRLWFVDQLSPDTAAYNIPVALRLQGPLDFAALAGSFYGVLRRHQALRTYFPMTETGPVQSVIDAAPARLGVVDATQTPEDQFRTELAEAARRPFDLGKGPLVRLTLYRRGADDHVLLLVMHHIVADGWSLGVMTEEVTAGYEALTRGLPDPGVPPQVQYPDYARWLSEHDGDAQGEHLEYWTRHLDGSVPLNLPTRQPRPALQSFAGAHHHWQLDARTTHALRKVCLGTDGTLFMVLLAAYGLLLGRHSYASDVVVGTPISGRTHLETEGVIGMFVNTLALRLDMSDDPTFTDLVLRVREVCLDGYDHQAVPFERLVETLQPARDLGRTPLFQSAFVLQNTPRPAPRLTGLAVERLELDTATSKFDISLELEESAGGLVGAFEYCTDLFDQETVARFASDFTRLLRSIAAGPHRLLSELTAAGVPPVAIAPQPAPAIGLRELIYRQSYATPKALAVSHGPRALTYEQLVIRASRLADELRARGLGEGSRIGLHQGRGADWVVGLLAVLVSGAACVLMDPSRPEEWNECVIREGRPHLVLHRENEPAAGLPAFAPEGQRPDEETACVCFRGDALAGVSISTADLAARVTAIRQEMAIAAGDQVLANSPQWKEAAIWECLGALTCGAAFIVPAAGEESSAVLERHAPAVVLATPEQADALGEAVSRGPRVVRIGESLPAHPTHPMRVVLTSMTAPPSSWEFDAADRHWYGHPLGAAQTEIRDRFGQPVEQGVCGQLHVTGTARTTGLTAEPATTPTACTADAGPGRQPVWHPTGVLARYGTDGRVEWLGSVQGSRREEKTSVPAVAPRTPAEEVVAAMWCEVLGGTTLSVHDDFFDLGGHSLAAVQIIGRIHSIFRVKVPIQSFFQDPSIAGFTSALTSLEMSPGQTEQIALIWKQVTGAASDENAFPVSGTDR